MNHHSSTKSSTNLTVIFTIMITVIVSAITIFVTTELYKKANYLDEQWDEFHNVLVKKQNVHQNLSSVFTDNGLLGDIQRYAFAPNKISESHIKSQLESYKDSLTLYRNLQGLSVVETRLLMTVNEEITKLKNSFYLALAFTAKEHGEKSTAIGNALYSNQGQEAIDKLSTSH